MRSAAICMITNSALSGHFLAPFNMNTFPYQKDLLGREIIRGVEEVVRVLPRVATMACGYSWFSPRLRRVGGPSTRSFARRVCTYLRSFSLPCSSENPD